MVSQTWEHFLGHPVLSFSHLISRLRPRLLVDLQRKIDKLNMHHHWIIDLMLRFRHFSRYKQQSIIYINLGNSNRSISSFNSFILFDQLKHSLGVKSYCASLTIT